MHAGRVAHAGSTVRCVRCACGVSDTVARAGVWWGMYIGAWCRACRHMAGAVRVVRLHDLMICHGDRMRRRVLAHGRCASKKAPAGCGRCCGPCLRRRAPPQAQGLAA